MTKVLYEATEVKFTEKALKLLCVQEEVLVILYFTL